MLSAIEAQRAHLARMMAIASRSADPRLERIFELVPREQFLGPGPWKIQVDGDYIETPSADPGFVLQNTLVALDANKGINNGEPLLHARWIGTVAPQPGEVITHIGAGTGYYSAILSMLVRPGGRVVAIELEPDLAAAARRNLIPFDNVSVVQGDATGSLDMPPSDIIYVNAAVTAPPVPWLEALCAGGRLIFPWRPSEPVGLAVLVKRSTNGFSAVPFMTSYFIPCAGAAPAAKGDKRPSSSELWHTRSIHLSRISPPDDSASAVYRDVWFSTKAVGS